MEDNQPRIFHYDDYEISIDLKLVGEDVNLVPQKYKSYWLTQGVFHRFFKIYIKLSHLHLTSLCITIRMKRFQNL